MKKIGDILQGFISELIPYPEHKKSEIELLKSWEKHISDAYVGHAQLLSVEEDHLRIAVDHPAWLQRLNEDSKDILENIHRNFPLLENITSIRCSLQKTKRSTKRKK